MWAPLCRTLALTATAVVVAAPVAIGQTPAAGTSPVFGAGPSKAADRQTLDITVNIAEAYDQDLMAEAGGGVPLSPVRSGGFFTMIVPSLDFESRGERLQVGVTAGSNARYYAGLHKAAATGHYVGAGMSARVSSHTSVTFNQGVTYAPAYLYGLFVPVTPPALGDVVPPASDYAISNLNSFAYSTMARLTHTVSPRATFSFASSHQYTQFDGSLSGYSSLRSYDAGGEYLYAVDRNVKLRVGYTYRNAQYTIAQRNVEHDVVAGLEYNRRLSPTRRTQISFAVGPILLTGPLVANEPRASRYFRLTGEASVDHRIGRTWHAQGAYHRGVSTIEVLPGPVYADAVSVQSAGFVSRRLDLLFSASYTEGKLAGPAQAIPISTYSGEARARWALSRTWAAYADYLFYNYTLDPSLPLPTGVAHGLKRNGVRVGVMLWLPVRI